MDRDKLDPKGLKAAINACLEIIGPVFGSPEYLADPVKLARAEKRRMDGARAHAEAAILAYLTVLHDRAAKQYAEIMAILDNPQPPTDALRKAVRDAAPLLSHTRAAAPSGWKMVPDDLTEDMIHAGIASLGSDDDRPAAEKVLDIYRAMSKARPLETLQGVKARGG